MKKDLFGGRLGILFLAAIVFLALFLHLGDVPLFDEDEGAYAEVSREMIDSGDWLVPRLEGKSFFHKPPMIYWTQAISIRLLGLNEFALRFPSALASLAWALVLFVFVRRFSSHRTAWLSVFFLVTALQTSIITKAAIADALLNLFITIAMLALYTHYQKGPRTWLYVAYASMALGFMTKGPIAIAIPAAVCTIFYLIQKRIGLWLKTVFCPVGWLIFLLIAAPWYLALALKFGRDFIGEIFWVHNLGRFQSAMEGHSGPVFYYIPIILAGLLPYTTLVLLAFAHVRQHWRSDLGRYLMLWFVFVLIFFSLAETKLHHYIIYGYVPLFIFMAQAFEHLRRPTAFMIPMGLFCLVLLLLPAVASMSAAGVDDEFARVVIQGSLDEFGTPYYLFASLMTAVVIALTLLKPLGMQWRVVAVGLLLLGLVNLYLMPKIADIMQGPVKSAALLAKEKDYDVVMWQMNYPSFNVYLGRQVLRRTPQPGDVVITKADKLVGIAPHDIIYQKHGIVLTRLREQ